VTWRYGDSELAGQSEAAITLLRWDATAGAWSTAGISAGDRNAGENRVSFTVARPGEYAFFSSPPSTSTALFLPLVQRHGEEPGGSSSTRTYFPFVRLDDVDAVQQAVPPPAAAP
jgi:hypothetical protein